jgi:peptidoglycan hydrolase-like protein with peptidoglycan-binding domain
MQKTTYGVLAIALLFTLAFSFSSPARAQSTPTQMEQIQTLLAMVEQLQLQLTQLQSGNSSGTQCTQLSRSLFLGSSDRDTAGEVSKLQRHLTVTGHYTYGKVTGYYGPATQRAVQAWQLTKGVVSSGSPETTGYGVVGPSTRNMLARSCNVLTPVVTPVEVAKKADTKVETLGDPAVVTYIGAKAAAPNEIFSGVTAHINGTGLAGNLTIKIGDKSINVTSDSDTSVKFVVPEHNQTSDVSVTITNSSGQVSASYGVTVTVF